MNPQGREPAPMTTVALSSAELTEGQFQAISHLVKDLCGINLHDGKRELVKARLNKRLRQLGMDDFSQYLDYIATDNGQAELLAMLDALSTNLTSFFREGAHFDLLRETIVPEMVRRADKGRRMRIWSAGCSTGEEPYSIAIVLKEVLSDLAGWDVRVLATDLSSRVLEIARRGIYGQDRLRQVPGGVIATHFRCVGPREPRAYQVCDQLRRIVTFARLNLMESWPMRGPFDAIFCRNVMIYFDKPTQNRLVERFWELLAPSGVLFIGHSESLAGVRHQFKYVQPTVYRRQ
jgi:chemotaxis protein methyltransferase CheR